MTGLVLHSGHVRSRLAARTATHGDPSLDNFSSHPGMVDVRKVVVMKRIKGDTVADRAEELATASGASWWWWWV